MEHASDSSHAASRSASAIGELARWTLTQAPLYREELAVRQAKLLILDSIGCAFAAAPEFTPQQVAALVEEMGGSADCTIIGSKTRTTVPNAVLLNGSLVRSLDLNDVQFFEKEGKLSVAGHCSDNIPVALAVGERFDSAGAAAIDAVIMGYELFRRLRRLMPFSSSWDGTSVSGLVAAAMAGRLMGLDETRQAHALALGAARCATPSVVRWGKLSGIKNLANSLIAQSGVLAALLAARGITGPLEVLEHRGGLHQVFDPSLGLESLWAPIREPLYILTSQIKPFACIGTAQTTITAALGMHERVKPRLGQIAKIEVIQADLPMIRKQQGEMTRRYPQTREAADHSFTFLPAVALTDGQLTEHQFDNERWKDPAIMRLVELTDLKVDPELAARAPDSMPSRVRVTFSDGEAVEGECLYHPGHSFPDRGLSQEVVTDKFEMLTGETVSPGRRRSVVEAVLGLHNGSVRGLMHLLGAE